MSNETREAFEAWISAPPHDLSIEKTPTGINPWNNQYRDARVCLAWEAWQKSTARFIYTAILKAQAEHNEQTSLDPEAERILYENMQDLYL